MAKYKRRRYFIDKQFQTKYMVLTILLLVVYTLLFVVILFTPYVLPLYSDVPLEEQTRSARMLLSLHTSVWPALGIVILTLGVLSVFITHKIAGPVYRFKKVLSEISAGNLNVSVHLRKRDDLKDLAEDLNMVIKELQVFVRTLQADHETLSKCILELEDQIRDNKVSGEAGRELIRKMQMSRENISQVLDKYSSESDPFK